MKKVWLSLKKKSHSPVCIYISISIISLMILFLCILFSHGEVISKWFFYDEADTAMDFFHSIEYVKGRSPYVIFETLYPPLANMLFYGIFHCIPMRISDQWTMSFIDSLKMRTTVLDLRLFQAPMIIFLIFLMVCVVANVIVMQRSLNGSLNKTESDLVVFCMIFSYGILQTVERGNIVLLVVPFTLLFINGYDSKNKYIRELSCISLAIAAGLKIYPAVLGILLLKEKNWKLTIRTIIYGIAAIFIPFLFFYEPFESVKIWIYQLTKFAGANSEPWNGNGFINVLYRLKNYISFYMHIELSDAFFSVIVSIIALFMCLGMLKMEKKWERVLISTAIMSFLFNQGNYVFAFYCIPMICFLAEEKRISKDNFIPFIIMLFLILPLPLFDIRNISYPRTAIVHLAYIFLLIWFTVIQIRNIKLWNKKKRKQSILNKEGTVK